MVHEADEPCCHVRDLPECVCVYGCKRVRESMCVHVREDVSVEYKRARVYARLCFTAASAPSVSVIPSSFVTMITLRWPIAVAHLIASPTRRKRRGLVSTHHLIIRMEKHKRDILRILNLSSTLALLEAGKECLSPHLLVL